MGCYKKNVAIEVQYLSLKKTEGLTDVTMRVYNPSNLLVNTVTLSEVLEGSGLGGGLYSGSFTPNVEGQWRIRITSATNGDDAAKTYEVREYNIDDIKGQLDIVEGKVDIIDGNVDSIKTTVETIDGKVDTIDSNVDSVKTTVEATATDVTTIKTKTDNLPADTASELTDIKDKLDNIDAQVNIGGYIL